MVHRFISNIFLHTHCNRNLLVICGLLFSACNQSQDSVHILFAGDMMLDRGARKTIEQKNIDYLFEDVTELFRQQDLVLVNFELTVCSRMLQATDKTYCFRADSEWLPTIHRSGITHVTLANNHIGDYGKEGLQQTMQQLYRNGIAYAGADSMFQAPCEPVLVHTKTSMLAVFSTTLLYEKKASGCCNERSTELSNRIAAFKKMHADYCIIVCLHWGIEMDTLPSDEQRMQAHALIDSGADLIIGHHPHVVQPIEMYKNTYICYSLGNFIFDTDSYPGNIGVFAGFDITDNTITLAQVIPFTLSGSKPSIMNKRDAKQFLKRKGLPF